MSRRIELQKLLEDVLGSKNVYFQPPPSVEIKYDCIVYERSQILTVFANSKPYTFSHRYQVTAIYKNPDSDLPKRIAQLPMCLFDRHFTADNLNHDVFNIYF